MKKVAIGTLVAALVIGIGGFAVAGPYGPGYGGGWGYGPMHMGPMMGGYGYGMGPGMMGGYGPGCSGWRGGAYAPTSAPAAQPLTKESATQLLQTYLARMGNPNLKLGGVTETDTTFEGKIVTKDGSLVEKLLVEKETGRMYPVF